MTTDDMYNGKDACITLAHGAGGRQTAALIARVFARHFQNPDFTADDAAILPVGTFATGRAAFTTDGFIVSPWQFPGGNIGKLSICGTVNDLACMGAMPRYLSCAFQIEEGFPMRDLEAIAAAMAKTAKTASVRIVAGDTKVAGRGQVDKVFITTTGIGELLPGAAPSGSRAEAGDAIIVTGDVGRHGAAILVARRDFAIDAAITSDCAPLADAVKAMFDAVPDRAAIHTIRDATRDASWLKRTTSAGYYKFLNLISEVPVQPGGSDFRLMDRKAVLAFRRYREHARFIRGLIGAMGFRQKQLHFTAPPRFAGSSKFSPRKMWRLAVDGVFTCSTFPLRLGLYFGMASLFASICLFLHVLYETFVREDTAAGWPTIMACLLFFGGMQLLILGIIGEYLGRTYEETKRRPLYLLARGKPEDLAHGLDDEAAASAIAMANESAEEPEPAHES